MWLENVFKHVPKNDHPYIKSVYYDGCDKNITSFPVAEDTIQRSFTTLEKELLLMCTAPQINDEKCTHQVNWLYNEYEWMKNKHGFWEPKHNSHVQPMNISTLELFSQHHQSGHPADYWCPQTLPLEAPGQYRRRSKARC